MTRRIDSAPAFGLPFFGEWPAAETPPEQRPQRRKRKKRSQQPQRRAPQPASPRPPAAATARSPAPAAPAPTARGVATSPAPTVRGAPDQAPPGQGLNGLRKGSEGEPVAELQRALNRFDGRDPLVVDQSFGALTDARVRAFQRAKGLTPDGIVGRHTLRELAPYVGAGRPSSPSPSAPAAAAPSAFTLGVSLDGTTKTGPVNINFGRVADQLATATVNASIPLRPNAELGPASVRPEGAVVHAQAGVTRGQVDPARTGAQIRDPRGRPTTLDGPLFFNPGPNVRVSPDGRASIDVPLIGSQDITKDILGPGGRLAGRVSSVLDAVNRGGALPENIDLVRSAMTGTVRPGEARGPAPARDTNSAFAQVVDTNGVRINGSGTFAVTPPGQWATLGDGARVRFGPGSTFNVTGTPNDMTMTIRANVTGAIFGDERGTSLTAGNANAGTTTGGTMEITVRRRGDRTEVSVAKLDLRDVRVTSPASEGRTNYVQLGAVKASGIDGRPPIVMERGNMRVGLDTTFSDVRGRLHLRGAEGEPATLRLGAEASTQPMSVTGRVDIDTARDRFAFTTNVANLHADVITSSPNGLRVVDQGVNRLSLSTTQLTGAGQINYSREGSRETAVVRADEPFSARVAIADASFGRELSGTGVRVQLAPGSEGTIRLRELSLPDGRVHIGDRDGPNPRPGMELDVRVAGLQVALPHGETVSLADGTHGTFIVDTLRNEPGAASPTMTGRVRVRLGGDLRLLPSNIEGLKDGEVRIRADIQRGETTVEFPFELRADGSFVGNASLRMREVEIRTEVTEGPPPVLPLPEKRDVERWQRRLAEQPPAPVANLTPLARPNLPSKPEVPDISFDPQQLVRDRVRGVDLDITTRLQGNGQEVTVHALTGTTARLPTGDVRLTLRGAEGTVVADGTRLTIHPPIEVSRTPIAASIANSLGFDGTGALGNRLQVGEFTLRRDGDRMRLVPNFGNVTGFTSGLVNSETVREYVGSLAAQALTGQSTLPADTSEMLASFVRSGNVRVRSDLGISTPTTGTAAPPVSPAQDPLAGLPPNLRAVAQGAMANLRVNATNGSLEPGRISLGNNQYLDVRSGRNVRVTANPDGSLSISGDVELGETRLGGRDAGLQLGRGAGRVTLRVSNISAVNPRVEVSIDNLNAEGLGLTARGPEAATQVAGLNTQGATVRLAYGGDDPQQFNITLPGGTVQEFQTTAADGSVYRLRNGSVGRLQIGPGVPSTVDVADLRGTFSGNMRVPGIGTRVEISSAEVTGGSFTVNERGELVTRGDGFAVRNARALIAHVPVLPSEGALRAQGGVRMVVDRAEATLERGHIRIGGNQDFALQPAEGTRLRLRGDANELGWHTPSPHITFVAPRASFDVEAGNFSVGPRDRVRLEITDGIVHGPSVSGTAVAGPTGSQLAQLQVTPETSFQMVLSRLKVHDNDAEVSAIISLDGRYVVPARPDRGPIAASADMRGPMRIFLASAEGRLSSRMEGIIRNGEATIDVQAQGPGVRAAAGELMRSVGSSVPLSDPLLKRLTAPPPPPPTQRGNDAPPPRRPEPPRRATVPVPPRRPWPPERDHN